MRRITYKTKLLGSTRPPIGNRLTANRAGAGPLPAGVTTMAYNAANQLILSQPPTGAPTTITYDANGNTLLENTGGSLTTYTWDFENRMTSAAYPDGTAETYTYYSDGLRASKAGEGIVCHNSGGPPNF